MLRSRSTGKRACAAGRQRHDAHALSRSGNHAIDRTGSHRDDAPRDCDSFETLHPTLDPRPPPVGEPKANCDRHVAGGRERC
jgi:hypothetical protein